MTQRMLVFGNVSQRQYHPLQSVLRHKGVKAQAHHVTTDGLRGWTDKMNHRLQPEVLFKELCGIVSGTTEETETIQEVVEDAIGMNPEDVTAGIIDRKCVEGSCSCSTQIETLDSSTCAALAVFSQLAEMSDQPGRFVSVQGKAMKMYTS